MNHGIGRIAAPFVLSSLAALIGLACAAEAPSASDETVAAAGESTTVPPSVTLQPADEHGEHAWERQRCRHGCDVGFHECMEHAEHGDHGDHGAEGIRCFHEHTRCLQECDRLGER